MNDAFYQPWVIVAPDGVVWYGEAKSEADAWARWIGAPYTEETERRKAGGWYCTTALLSWRKPGDTRAARPVEARESALRGDLAVSGVSIAENGEGPPRRILGDSTGCNVFPAVAHKRA